MPVAPATIVIPAGTEIWVKLDQTLSTRRYHAGDPFSGTLLEPVRVNGQTVIPTDAQVSGTITQSKSKRLFKRSSVLALRLDSITTEGHTYPIQTFDLVNLTDVVLSASNTLTFRLDKDVTISQ